MTELERTNDQGHFLHSYSSLMHEISITQFILFWIHKMKFLSNTLHPFVHLPVSLFVNMSGVFLRNHLKEFSNFLHKVKVSSSLNSEGAQALKKKIDLWFLGPKRGFPRFLKLHVNEVLKLT